MLFILAAAALFSSAEIGDSNPTSNIGLTNCVAGGPAYYRFGLFTTRNVPGTGLATGAAEVSVIEGSPFSVSLSSDGSYVYDLQISLERMRIPAQGHLVAWVTTPEIDHIQRIGAFDADLTLVAPVAWNKFIVVITLEPINDPTATTWTGPIAFRGMSRSGLMHTMAGHGAFDQENCAIYGYGN
jgi:hypothetical protein|tara:strand:+ start:2905 stop:3456 length:552 start_codon:yes stop_codon:yes gene_type:complete